MRVPESFDDHDADGLAPGKFARLMLLFLLQWISLSCIDKPSEVSAVEDLDVDGCILNTSEYTLDVITWNLRTFPLSGAYTVQQVAEILLSQEADIIALQEVASEEDFNHLVSLLPGWKGTALFHDGLALAFLYKEKEIALLTHPTELFDDNHYAFPRPPLLLEIVHTSGIETVLVNLHLKCCGGEENERRRREASILLKDYLDTHYSDRPVVVLGDFNDEIAGVPDDENVFINYLNDAEQYRFADLAIAKSDRSDWSYPSYPSHIDHILITDELFSLVDTVGVLTYDLCDGRYFRYISDHRPLLLRLVN